PTTPVAAAQEKIVPKYGIWGNVAANPGMAPVLGTWRPTIGKESVKRNQAVLDFVRRKNIKTVILASDWRGNTLGRENGSLDTLIVDDENQSVDKNNAAEVLRRGLQKTTDELRRAGADVWIMRQVPSQRELPSQRAFNSWLSRAQLPEFGVTLDD